MLYEEPLVPGRTPYSSTPTTLRMAHFYAALLVQLCAALDSFEHEAPDVSRSILEGLDEILTVIRLGLPPKLRRSLASTNIIESMNSVIRKVCRNVKRWRNAKMALRWTAAGMFEAKKGFRRIKAYKQLPILKQALIEHRQKAKLDQIKDAA